MEIRHEIAFDGQILNNYYHNKTFMSVIRGPVGSGKTIASCLKMLKLISEQTPSTNGTRSSRWLACRNTYSELFSTTITDFCMVAEGLGKFKNGGGGTPPSFALNYKLPDGTTVKSTVLFVSFDTAADLKKAKGLQLTGVFFNELCQLDEMNVTTLLGRCGRFPSKKQIPGYWDGGIADTNSFDDSNWLYRVMEVDKPQGWEFFHQPGGLIKVNNQWEPNPLAENLSNLKDNYYTQQAAAAPADYINVLLANNYGFMKNGLPVHENYNDDVHCVDMDFTPVADKPMIMGYDFGRTPAATMMQEHNGQWIVFDEFTAIDVSAAEFAPALRKYISKEYPQINNIRGHGDPTGGSGGQATSLTPFTILNDHNLPAQPTDKSNDVLKRRSAVSKPLQELCMTGAARLIILPKCTTLRKGLGGGFFYEKVNIAGTLSYKQEPNKGPLSHVVEALEYGLLGEGEGITNTPNANNKYTDWSIPL